MTIPSAPPAPSTPPGEIEIAVYTLVTPSSPHYQFFAIAYPPGQRPVYAFDDKQDRVESRVRHLLEVGNAT